MPAAATQPSGRSQSESSSLDLFTCAAGDGAADGGARAHAAWRIWVVNQTARAPPAVKPLLLEVGPEAALKRSSGSTR